MYYWNGKISRCYAGILLNFDDDDYSQGYHQIKEAFKALTKDDILQPYISDENFRTSNVRVVDVGYNLFVFDITDQKKTLQTLNQLKWNLNLMELFPMI